MILTDLRMPNMDGVQLIREVLALGRDTRVVVLTTYDSDADILHAVEAGASGYLLKDAPREQIIESIKAVASGETALSPRVAARLVAHINTPSAASLTGREREILTLVAQGYTNQKIARILAISISTVKTHLERSYEKLGVSDRASAVSQALARGLISSS
ncbi:response regulator transcription factor [Scrofimicrobium canadense]|uniref:response regulator transcription factor n=1 Tax=Scrofimicrobium canadense TaxID=2652290 RepID=UPI00298D8A03|nr:response regulator transcription factor [Scrofimicrobium canadense]